MKNRLFLSVLVLSLFAVSCKRDIKSYANYDESKAGFDSLPDPLICNDGTIVDNDSIWINKRRGELIRLFEDNIYGRTPQRANDTLIFEVTKLIPDALDGLAILKEITVYFTPQKDTNNMQILLLVPKNADGPAPCFASLNFWGNQCVSEDPVITLSNRWMRGDGQTITNNHATDSTRGIHQSRWPLSLILTKGYAVATVYYGDLDPDYDDGFKNGIQHLFYREGQTRPDSNQWGAIGAWAWGMSRILDYLETDTLIDAKKVISIGHSRLGKTALWAGAQDQRFAMVISNNSGCCGAALSKRNYGENAYIINTIFPHWFCDNFKKYNNNESALPVDQHELIALIAPRPVYIASASEDQWADPKGEFQGALHANPVFKLFGETGFPPAPDRRFYGTIGYHLRQGKHDITEFDWERYIAFADYHFGK